MLSHVSMCNLTGGVTCYVLYLIYFSLAIDHVEPAKYKNVEEGKPIDIKCGKKTIKHDEEVTWSKGEEKNLDSLPRFKVDDNGTLHINATKKNDSGLFTCLKRKKGENLTYSVNIYLNVECKYNSF